MSTMTDWLEAKAKRARDLREECLFGDHLDETAFAGESEQLFLLALAQLEVAERYLKLAAMAQGREDAKGRPAVELVEEQPVKVQRPPGCRCHPYDTPRCDESGAYCNERIVWLQREAVKHGFDSWTAMDLATNRPQGA